jgi:hypothetical protein
VREVDEEEVGRVVDVRLDRRQQLVVQVVRLLGAEDGVQDVQHEEVGEHDHGHHRPHTVLVVQADAEAHGGGRIKHVQIRNVRSQPQGQPRRLEPPHVEDRRTHGEDEEEHVHVVLEVGKRRVLQEPVRQRPVAFVQTKREFGDDGGQREVHRLVALARHR